ncbi:MAG: hypothetical protein AAF215_33570 [Cyanobacteria bacterium P01_A01_bin.123]
MQQPNPLTQAQATDLETRLREYQAIEAQYRQLEAKRADMIAHICRTLVGCGQDNHEFTTYILLDNGAPALVTIHERWEKYEWQMGGDPALEVVPLRSLVDALEGSNE